MTPTVRFAHVGIQKTGSTWLQNGLFYDHPQLQMMGEMPRGYPLADLNRLVQDLFAEDVDYSAWRADFERQQTRFDAHRLLGMSNEQLGGHVWDTDGGIRTADHMKTLCGDLQIILVLRNPVQWLQSAYQQTIKVGMMAHRFDVFLTHPDYQADVLRRLQYHRLIEAYRARFSQVLVLPFELLRDDAQAFVDAIADFLAIDRYTPRLDTRRNPAVQPLLYGMMRHTNRVDLALWPRRRYISKAMRRLTHILPDTESKPRRWTRADFAAYPAYDTLFQAEHYRIWSGDWARYNYFQDESHA